MFWTSNRLTRKLYFYLFVVQMPVVVPSACRCTDCITYHIMKYNWHKLLQLYRVGQKNWTCLSVDNSAMLTRRKACDMSKVLECCRQKGPNSHSKSFKYSLPSLPKSSLPLKLGICLYSHVPEFIELKNSLPKSPWFKFCELISVGTLQQIAWSQNFRNWPVKTCANRMLALADSEHIDSSDRSAA